MIFIFLISLNQLIVAMWILPAKKDEKDSNTKSTQDPYCQWKLQAWERGVEVWLSHVCPRWYRAYRHCPPRSKGMPYLNIATLQKRVHGNHALLSSPSFYRWGKQIQGGYALPKITQLLCDNIKARSWFHIFDPVFFSRPQVTSDIQQRQKPLYFPGRITQVSYSFPRRNHVERTKLKVKGLG